MVMKYYSTDTCKCHFKNDVELTISDIDSKIIFLQELFPLYVGKRI
jgi:hypothetical protein